MNINESKDRSHTSQQRSLPFLSFSDINKKPSQQHESHKDESTITTAPFDNRYRNAQILVSIVIVVLSTLWVQITMQHDAPFIRTAQSYFNELVLLHTSQDIYEGTDVVYYRTGQYYLFKDMIGLYSRLRQTIEQLQTDSMFTLRTQIDQTGRTKDSDVELLVKYYYPKFDVVQNVFVLESPLQNLDQFLNSTLLNRTFYEFLWQTQLYIHVPILYRQNPSILQIQVRSFVHSSFLLQLQMDINILDSNQNLIQTQNSSQFEDDKLGIRKRNDPVDIQLDAPFLQWVILLLFLVVFALQFNFIFHKNQHVNQKIRNKIREEKTIEKLINQFHSSILENTPLINDSSNESKEEEKIDPNQHHFKIPNKYQIAMKERLSRIGPYYIVQVILSTLALLGYYNDHSGVVCLFAWMKLVAYLSQTKNTLMIGFLFEEALPIYFKIFFNIIILITAFVLFDMLVYPTSRKFETVELSYFEYFFNYFQYGIYQNFILGLQVHGMLAQFFYFLQLMILLYIGNNILQSILASQVLKNSYLKSVEQMIDDFKMSCPACGADFHQQKKLHRLAKHTHQTSQPHHSLMSKFISDYDLQSRPKNSVDQSSDYNIVVTSPLLSPFFPTKNQKEEVEQKFISPKLKGGQFQRQIREINNLKTEQQKSPPRQVQELNKINSKYTNKKAKIQISESKLVNTLQQNKFHPRIRSKIQLLFEKIDKFNQIEKEVIKKAGYSTPISKYNQIKSEVLSNLLERIQQFRNRL